MKSLQLLRIIASSKMLSIKITSDSIEDEFWFSMYKKVVNKEFKRGHNFELTHVKK